MKHSKVALPSNRKFGFFFTLVFFFSASYFFLNDRILIAYIFLAFVTIFLLITLVNADALLSLNKLWMKLGQLLGKIISPIILSIIFFLLVTPYGLVMCLFRRDELCLKLGKRESLWKSREQITHQTNFTQQF
tara:strand:+ start:341 stop:739 length:399 start_codon:yes stop_codon:yes gene_type:complete